MSKLHLKNARLNKGLSQETLADLIGMTQCNYSRRENGKKEITLNEWTKIANVLNVNLDEIYQPFVNNAISDITNDSQIQIELKSKSIYIESLEKENAFLKNKIKDLEK
ncbi:helix-turn-helix domain-containing protein [Flavobacterium sp. ov086]|uniref:helix-turn-helix domain-containing protein n=1 Tax=Flavobacterium sp. ov086 TaxID=1761785 RepID=UPI000B644311|nr:helix-turn-helix transcriptional regulator [Flavobacterium sp. ov086]SNR95456.1 DNA-binding transcriptional regulator, XRE-family HTH domain [Flavobacterium sp. ov086]